MHGTFPKTTMNYRNEHCEGQMRSKYTKAAKGSTAQITPALEVMQQVIDEYLKTEEGIKMLKWLLYYY